MATPPRPPTELVDDLVEEVLLRVPLEDPSRLLRAALVCKRWCRLVSDPRFRRRFRERHATPPMLGFLYYGRAPASFDSTTSFRPPDADRSTWRALDARHGRVLASPYTVVPREADLIVWDPITGELRRLPMPQFDYSYWTAAVLCAAAGCDHLDCASGPFLVVVVGTDDSESSTSACVYSSEASAWSELTSIQHFYGYVERWPCVLVGKAPCFLFDRNKILKYHSGTREISVIPPPPVSYKQHIVLMTTEDGRLGFATVHESILSLWSREAGPDGDEGWVQSRVIDLEALLPVKARATSPEVVGFADGIRVILVRAVEKYFTVDLKSSRVKMIGEGLSFYDVVPYMSFYTPVLGAASSGAGPRVGASTTSQTGGAHVRASQSRENLATL